MTSNNNSILSSTKQYCGQLFRQGIRRLAAALLLVGLASSGVFATTYTFNNMVDDQWATPENWMGGFPGYEINSGDLVVIPGNCVIINDLNIAAGGTLSITSNGQLNKLREP